MKQWFRAYNEIRTDPKVQKLPADKFRKWFNILCIANEHDGLLPNLEETAFHLRMNVAATETLLEFLTGKDLLDKTEHGLKPHNWDGRQFQSDDVNTRVQRFRGKRRNVTKPLPETPPDSDQTRLRPDSDQKRNGYDPSPGWEWFLSTYPPHRMDRSMACQLWISIATAEIEQQVRQHLPKAKATEEWQRQGGRFVPKASNYMADHHYERVLADETEQLHSSIPEWKGFPKDEHDGR